MWKYLSKSKENDNDEPVSLERRKLISNAVPALVGSILQARNVLPNSQVETTEGTKKTTDLPSEDQNALRRKFIEEKLPGLLHCKVVSKGPRRFELLLDRSDIVTAIIEPFLRRRFLEESRFMSYFGLLGVNETAESGESFDAILKLRKGSVYVKLIQRAPRPEELRSLQQSASRLDPSSEVWIFVTSGMDRKQEERYIMDNSYASERNFVIGRMMVLGLNGLLAQEIDCDERFTIENIRAEDSEGNVGVVFAGRSSA